MKAVTKNEKLIAIEDMLYNSFCEKPASRKAVTHVGRLMAKTINDVHPMVITNNDIEKIVDKLESRMDFKMVI